MDDLNGAIIMNERAVESIPSDHPDRAVILNNLGITLQSRFERTGSIDDIDRAVTINEQAVISTPIDHPGYIRTLENLGAALQSRFERTRSKNDLQRAITANEQAISSIPNDHPDRAIVFSNFGIALQSRFKSTGSMDDLDRSIIMSEHAVVSTPDDHPSLSVYLNNLGTALQMRFERTGLMDDLDRSVTAKEQAATMDIAPPYIRLLAAHTCSNFLISQKDYNRAKYILQTAVRLLPIISPRALKRGDQQYNISRFANITSRAVSISLESAEDPYISLQLLELGRGILEHLQLEVRSDISVLAGTHPNIAQQFRELRDRIDLSTRTFNSSVIIEPSIDTNPSSVPVSPISTAERQKLVKQFDDLLGFIRGLDGFDNFLRGPSKSEMLSLAEYGPIVAFNVSDIRSDAFIITTHEIRSLRLPLLTSDSLDKSVKRFLDIINRELRLPDRYRSAIREVDSILKWLWDVAVGPILDELRFTKTPPDGEAWPRVWWIGSGLLNILPIHASGYHDSKPPKSALDRVISSYAPTIKALSYARERAKADQLEIKEKAILVSMPVTPEQSDLPYVMREVECVKKLFSKTSIDTMVVQNSTRADVLSKLSKCTIAHFACHGNPADDPSQSSLLLEDWKSGPLTVSDLISLNIESAKFAYLSACHTSAMRDLRLLDESISLSSAIQLSGYPSVVGSLWQVADNHSAEVARIVYEWILVADKLDVRRSAEGLHKAMRILRDSTRTNVGSLRRSNPLVWAPYIYIGI
jgi:tetratricopeptide (TPR) repeat protein